jgi:hypothetical protein
MVEKSNGDVAHRVSKLVGWWMRYRGCEYDVWRFDSDHPVHVSSRPSFVLVFDRPSEIECCMKLNTYKVVLNQQ